MTLRGVEVGAPPGSPGPSAAPAETSPRVGTPHPPVAPANALPPVEECLAQPDRWRARPLTIDGIEHLRPLSSAPEALGVIQLAPGRLHGQFDRFGLGAVRVTVSFVNVPVRVWDRPPPGWRYFSFVRQGTGYAAMNGHPIRPGDLLEFPPGAAFEGQTPRDYRWVAVEIHPTLLAEALRARGVPDPGAPSTVTVRRVGPQAYLQVERLTEALAGLLGRPTTRSELEPQAVAWTALLVDVLASSRAAPARASSRQLASHGLLTRAEVYVREHLGEPVYVGAVSQAAGASERNLQHVFRQRLGTSPMEYIELLRLHRVRDALCAARGAPDAHVGTLARPWIPGHLGRFARTYRAYFGESPSQTLRPHRRRGGPPPGPATPPPTG